MHIVSRSVRRPRALILPLPVDAAGAAVESLTSWFEALCEVNQVSANVVMTSVVLPWIRHSDSGSRLGFSLWSNQKLPLLMGTAGTIDICNALTSLSGATGLQAKTLLAWNAHCGTWPLLLTSNGKRWCPSCYADDLEQYGRTYDRLLWQVEGVAVCTKHQTELLATCLSCGRSGHRHLCPDKVAGFCQYCAAWLGKCAVEADPAVGHETRYEYWAATSIEAMLDRPNESWDRSASSLALMLNALCNRHHADDMTDMGRHLNRGKGSVWGWLHGNIRPNNEALQMISFAYQIPMHDLLLGNFQALESAKLVVIPRHRSRRRSYVRALVRYDDADVLTLLRQTARSPQDTKVRTMRDLGKAVGRSPRDLLRRFPDEMALAKGALAALRAVHVDRRRADRQANLLDEIALALDALPPEINPSRRRMVKLMASRGVTLTYQEEARLPDLIQQMLAKKFESRHIVEKS